MKKLFKQLISFGIVGIIATVIDYAFMVLFTEIFGVQYLISCAISFTISVIVNYILSIRFVFSSNTDLTKWKEISVFIILSVIGLGINQLIMWLLVEQVYINYLLAKVGATAIVMIYNFISRKLFLERK